MGKAARIAKILGRLAWPRAHAGVDAGTRWVSGILLGLALWSFHAHAHAQGMLEGASPTQSAFTLPVVHEELRIQVEEQAAHVVVEQHFQNTSSERLEGRYLFRTPEGARVSGLSYWNGDQEIVGEVFERELANQVYEEVTGIGRDPALFEQVGEGSFSFRIFPLEPGEIKRVRVRVDLWLSAHGDEVELRWPVSNARTEIHVDVRDGRGVAAPTSPSHRLRIDGRGKEAHVEASEALGTPTDFVLRYQSGAPLALNAALHRDAGQDGYVLLHMATPTSAAREDIVPKDITLVIDHSGSMGGEPLSHACAAARQVVQSLDPRDRINLVVFDDKAEALFPGPRASDDAVRGQVLSRIDHLASGGGTDIALALKTTLAAQDRDARPNVVLFLTDGQSDARAALEAAQADASDTRIFTIGLGSGVEKPLLARLSAENRGRFVFIADTAAIEQEVARLYRQISAPLITDLWLESEGTRLEDVYPRTLRDLFVDDELRVFARVTPDAHGAVSLTARVHGKLRGQDVTYEARVDSPRELARRWVGMGWAQARVDDLLEEIALHGEGEGLKDEAIELALAYNFVTPYTAFLAIPQSELNDAAADMVASARAAKRKLREAHPDAAALSRTEMPPGDPIIAVRAPRDARQVAARFPFGLTLDLAWDELTERWMSRFLVPNDVADGVYEVDVWTLRADGTLEHTSVAYEIDSAAGAALLDVREVPGGLLVRVLGDEPLGHVRATLVMPEAPEATLQAASTGACAWGFLPAEAGPQRVRVVVTDGARNERVLEASVELSGGSEPFSTLQDDVCL